MVEASTQDLKDALPSLTWLSPGSEDFAQRRIIFSSDNPAVPEAILCPRNREEVAEIVRLAQTHNIPFSVRSGGHDLRGRSIVHGALCIDMRDIDYVEVAEDRKSAVIGGGVCFGKLLTELHQDGLITPHGSVPSIGYVGWASLGGYGCISTHFGLGVDQILEAEVVNDKGEIVLADENMLRGIRGAGGNFGIIVSLRIKVYEVRRMLAGMLIFETDNSISRVFQQVIGTIKDLECRGQLPTELVLQPLVVNHPQAGRTLVTTYVWSSDDHDKGRRFLECLIKQLPATIAMNTVTEMSSPDWVYMLDKSIAKNAWGGSQAISFGKMSPRVLDILGEKLQEMPSDPNVCFSLHSLSSQSPSVTQSALRDASCFNPDARQSHTLIEIVGAASSEAAMEACVQWATSLREALFATGESTKGSYISLVDPTMMSLQDIYGEKYDDLKALKREYDPHGVFKYAVPRLLG